MRIYSIFIFLILILGSGSTFGQQQFELENNFLHNISFITGQNEGIEQNLTDNFSWMQSQGYTHLRFFGIYPNGHHIFPSPTLDANNYPTNPNQETTLGILVDRASQYGITINFDGWEVIAESNRDTTNLGVNYITEDELAAVVQDVLATGVDLITEEQFGASYLLAIQAATSEMGATHETTASGWWYNPNYADEQLASVFNFYTYNQAEMDSLTDTYPPSNIGNLRVILESSQYYDYPISVAVGSFGSLESENWKNVLLFSQLLNHPERFSIEEMNTGFTIWNQDFNFTEYVGNEIAEFANQQIADRPIANIVLDSSWIFNEYFRPAYNGSIINNPAFANTLSLLGYQVVQTADSVLPDADFYVLQLAGGANSNDIAQLPDYVMPLLNGDAPVIIQPSYGIPDENDSQDWDPLRDFFGLPGGDTQTLIDQVPETVTFDGHITRWGGASLWLAPYVETINSALVDTTVAQVVVSEEIAQQETALLIQHGNKFLINSNLVHLETSFILSSFYNGPLNVPSTSDIVISEDKVLIFAEYNAQIDLDLPWTGTTHVIRYDPEGNRILDADIQLDGNYSESLARGEFVYLRDPSVSAIPEPVSSVGTPLEAFTLSKSHPNPFNQSTRIRVELSTAADLRVVVFNVCGQVVGELANGRFNAGVHTMVFDASSMASGLYFVRATIPGRFDQIQKMMLVK